MTNRITTYTAVSLIALNMVGCATKTPVHRPQSPATTAVPPMSGPAGTNVPVELAGVLQPVIDDAGIPGAVAVVLRGDQIIAQGAVGFRTAAGADPVTLADAFELASCTKAVTATLTALLIEEGRLSWETTIGAVFADTFAAMDPAWQAVTVRQVLAHRSGMKDQVFAFLRSARESHGDLAAQRRDYTQKILARPPDEPPGARFRYGSTNYVVVAAALEKLTAQSFEALVLDRLFRPLDITSGGFGPPGTPGRVDQPWGHGRLRLLGLVPLYGFGHKSFDPGSPNADFPRAGAPAGMVHVSVLDWAKFVALHLRGDPANPHHRATMLQPATFAILHQPAEGESYAGGWFTGTRPWARGARADDSGRVLYHEGENGRWTCVAWLAPEIDLAILVACNHGGMSGSIDKIAAALVGKFARVDILTDVKSGESASTSVDQKPEPLKARSP